MLKATSVSLSEKTKQRGWHRRSLGFLLPHFYFIFYFLCAQSFRALRHLKMEVESLSFNLILMLTAFHYRASLSATFFSLFIYFSNAGLIAESLYWVCWWWPPPHSRIYGVWYSSFWKFMFLHLPQEQLDLIHWAFWVQLLKRLRSASLLFFTDCVAVWRVRGDSSFWSACLFWCSHYCSEEVGLLSVWKSSVIQALSALSWHCVFDWQVYDGENTSSRLLGNYTRADMLGQVVNSTSNRLWLEFNSNASGTNQGFHLAYTSESFDK